MVALRIPRYTPEQYLAWEREADHKHEYMDGEIYAMAGASPPHVRIGSNVGGEFYVQLKGKPCQHYTADLKVEAGADDLFTYPDVVVVCGEPQFRPDKGDTKDVLTNPNVIVEVLSPSTEAFDRGEKFARFRRVESLTDYVLIAQDKVRVEHYERQANGKWLLTTASDLADVIRFVSIGCELLLTDIYDKVDFPAQATTAEANETV